MKECNQCGKCCTQYSDGGLSASASDLEGWAFFKPDIDRYVRDGKIWMDPVTGQQLPLCPWLQKLPDQNKFGCSIYFDRPEDCRHYPVTIEQMVTDGCEMLEVRDLANPRKAQKTLDIIMCDSRPPLE